MMKKTLLLLAGVAMLAGCACKTPVNNSICASYRGILPAADAPGIVTTLTFDNNNRYLERQGFIGRTDGVFLSNGNYTIKNNILTAVNAAGEKTYYRVEDGQLRRLDTQKKVIQGNMADYYILPQTAGCVPFYGTAQ